MTDQYCFYKSFIFSIFLLRYFVIVVVVATTTAATAAAAATAVLAVKNDYVEEEY